MFQRRLLLKGNCIKEINKWILTKWDYSGKPSSPIQSILSIFRFSQISSLVGWNFGLKIEFKHDICIFDIPYHIFAAVLKVIIMVAVKIKMTSWVDRFAVPEPKLKVTTPRILFLPPVVDDDPMRTILTICNYSLQFIHARRARIKGSLRSTNWMNFQNKHFRSNNLLQIYWRYSL